MSNMKNEIKKVLIVAGILIIYIVASFFMIREYNWNRQNITGPETPIEIAREFMQKRYNYHWGILMGMNYAGRDTGYDVAYIIPIRLIYESQDGVSGNEIITWK